MSRPDLSGILEAANARRRAMARRTPPWWLAACVVALLLASDYRLRTRDSTETLSGAPDLAILVEIAVYAAVGLVAVVVSARSSVDQRPPRLLHMLWAVAGVMALTSVYSPYGLFSVVRAAQLLVVAALAHAAARTAVTAEFGWLVRAFTLLVGASVLLGAVLPFERSGPASDRFSWLFVHPTTAGSYLAIAVLLLVCHLGARTDRTAGVAWPRALQWPLLILCTGGLLATQTRGSIAAAVVGCIVAFWTRNTRSRRIDMLIGGTVVLGLLALAAGDVVVEYLQRGEGVESLTTLNSRTGLWSMMLELWARRPLFGYGLGASRGLLLEETGLGGGHNAVVNVLLDAGVLGLLVWLIFLTGVIRYLLVLRHDPRIRLVASTLLGVITALLMNGLTSESLVVPATVASAWVFVIAAWTLALVSEIRSSAIMNVAPDEVSLAYTYAWWLTGSEQSSRDAVLAATDRPDVPGADDELRVEILLRRVRSAAIAEPTMCPASELALLHDAIGLGLDAAAGLTMIDGREANTELAHGRLEALGPGATFEITEPQRLGGLAVGNPADVAAARQNPALAELRRMILQGRDELVTLSRIHVPEDLLQEVAERRAQAAAPAPPVERVSALPAPSVPVGVPVDEGVEDEDDWFREADWSGDPDPITPDVDRDGESDATPADVDEDDDRHLADRGSGDPIPVAEPDAVAEPVTDVPTVEDVDLTGHVPDSPEDEDGAPSRRRTAGWALVGLLAIAGVVALLLTQGGPDAPTEADPSEEVATEATTAPAVAPTPTATPTPATFTVASAGVAVGIGSDPDEADPQAGPFDPVSVTVEYEGAQPDDALLVDWTVGGQPFGTERVDLSPLLQTARFSRQVPEEGWPAGQHTLTFTLERTGEVVGEAGFEVLADGV